MLVDEGCGFTDRDFRLWKWKLLKDVPHPLVDIECRILADPVQLLIEPDGRTQKDLFRACLDQHRRKAIAKIRIKG